MDYSLKTVLFLNVGLYILYLLLFKSSEQTGTGINQSPPDFTFHTQYTILGQCLFYGLHRTAHGGADRVMIPGHDTLEYSTIAPQVEGELVVPTR